MDPGTGTATASKFGNTATHIYATELDYSTSPAFFDSDYSGLFERNAVEGERASAESIYHFSVDTPVVYDILGSFSVTDGLGTTIPGNVELEVELLEFDHPFDPSGPPPTTVFYNWQNSKSTIDEDFAIGGTEGDFVNSLVGMPTGILDPAKFYRYRTLVTINAIDIDGGGPMFPTDGTASATGAQTILFFPPEPIPEPSASYLLVFMAWIAQRRKRNF